MGKVLRNVMRAVERASLDEVSAGALAAGVAQQQERLKQAERRAARATSRQRGRVRSEERKISRDVGHVVVRRLGGMLNEYGLLGLCEHLEQTLNQDKINELEERGRRYVESTLAHPVALHLHVPDAGAEVEAALSGLPMTWTGKIWSGKANLVVLVEIAHRFDGDLWALDDLHNKLELINKGKDQPGLAVEEERRRAQLSATAGNADHIDERAVVGAKESAVTQQGDTSSLRSSS